MSYRERNGSEDNQTIQSMLSQEKTDLPYSKSNSMASFLGIKQNLIVKREDQLKKLIDEHETNVDNLKENHSINPPVQMAEETLRTSGIAESGISDNEVIITKEISKDESIKRKHYCTELTSRPSSPDPVEIYHRSLLSITISEQKTKAPSSEMAQIDDFLETIESATLIEPEKKEYISRSGRQTKVKSYMNCDFAVEKSAKKIHPFLMNAQQRKEYKEEQKKVLAEEAKERRAQLMIQNQIKLQQEKIFVNLVSQEFSKGKQMNPFFDKRANSNLSNSSSNGLIALIDAAYPNIDNFHVLKSKFILHINQQIPWKSKIQEKYSAALLNIKQCIKIKKQPNLKRHSIECKSLSKIEVIKLLEKFYGHDFKKGALSEMFRNFCRSEFIRNESPLTWTELFMPQRKEDILGDANQKTANKVIDWLLNWGSDISTFGKKCKPAKRRKFSPNSDSDSDAYSNHEDDKNFHKILCIQGETGSGKTSMGTFILSF